VNEPLYLSHDGVRIGRLEDRAGLWRLTYDPAWVASPQAFPLSPHLALRAEPYDDGDEDGLVMKFFDNLLPEGEARQRLERRLNADPGNSFDLLSRFGRETAGALTIATDAQLVPDDDRYQELPRPELLDRVRRLRSEGGSLLEAARMSLAGTQDKMAVRMQPGRPVELMQGLLLPVDQAPASHIIKPQPAAARQLPHVAVNEFFCMTLASRLKLPAPRAHLLFAPGPDDGDPAAGEHDGPEWIYGVQRYDRIHDKGGQRLRRVHQIDFLQLRNE
jgi:serine/threonine-protein kinase HipA